VTVKGPAPKNSRMWQSSVPREPIGLPALLWMSFPTKRKSLAVGFVIHFHLLLPPSSMCEGQGGFYGRATIDKRGGGRRWTMCDRQLWRERSTRSVTWGEVRRDYHMLNNSYGTSELPTYNSSAIAPDADIISSLRTGPCGWDSSQKNPFSWCFLVSI
jgi:hypothetical protein